MKKLLPTLLLLLLVSPRVSAQRDFAHRYEGATPEELAMTEFAPDPEAEAVVMYEKGEYFFQLTETPRGYKFRLNIVVTSKIKIFKQAGLSYADLEIPYYYSLNDVDEVEIEGATYNLNNGMVTRTLLDQKNIFTEEVGNNIKVKKAAMPDVRVGSVVEMRYVIKTDRLFRIRPWRFQKKIPVTLSVLEFRAIPYYQYAFILKGTEGFDEQENETGNVEHTFYRYKYREGIFRFIKKNIPAFRDEEFLSNTDDHMANLYFQLSRYYNGKSYVDKASTWEKLCSDLRKNYNFGKYITASQKNASTILGQLNLNGKSTEEKVRTVTEYVKSMYSWNGDNSLFTESKLQDFLKEKRGNSADLNLFLIGMLRAAGIDCNPVALSTRGNGTIYKEYPFLEFFDYVIGLVQDGDKAYFVDATNIFGKFNEASHRCTNVEGLLIRDKSETWIAVVQNEVARESHKISITLDPLQGTARFENNSIYSGSRATAKRALYNSDKTEFQKTYRSMAGIELQEMTAENFEAVSEPFVVKSKYNYIYGEPGADRIIFNPLVLQAPTENPFRQTNRLHPVDLATSSVISYSVDIKIPEGYEIEYTGTAANERIPGGAYGYVVAAAGDKIAIQATFNLKNIFMPEEYAQLKKLYGDMVEKFSDVVILRKSPVEQE